MLLEALVIGFVAAVLGIAVGVGLAAGITAIMKGSGVDLPSSGLVIGTNTIVQGLLIGLIVTALAAISPAIKATRVPPLAALRDVAIDRAGASKFRLIGGIVVLAARRRSTCRRRGAPTATPTSCRPSVSVRC